MATPGYPELIGEMISLNFDRGLTAFIFCRISKTTAMLLHLIIGVECSPAVEDNDSRTC